MGLAHTGVFTHNPTVPEVGLAPSREPLQPSAEKGEQSLKTSIGSLISSSRSVMEQEISFSVTITATLN